MKHRELGLTDEQAISMYRYMTLARRTDERTWLLNRAGKIPFVISCQGHEAAQIGAGFALDTEKDWLCPYYRDMGLVMVMGQTAQDYLLSSFAKAEDPNSGGRQMPGHFGDHRYRILTGSSPVTTQMVHATGIAYAGKLDKKDFVVLTTCGEGSANQGDLHEAMNFAGVHKLPVIFMVQNNQYAISVPLEKQVAGGSIAARGAGYGMPGVSVDGNDPLEVYRAVKEAVERGRRGEGPTLVETISYRLVPHSSDDDDRTYRSREEVEEAKKKDSLFQYRQYLLDHGLLTEESDAQIEAEIKKEVDAATDYAEKAAYPDPSETYKYVFAE
ncbi:2-oxoisovalerate dehydrogenase E1 component alpha subunit [Croceifilum oryzae]|uniref:2-oxoisovalerate dehydrogenase subunit alpha n=2 Tax=Croceifilum oryzae TaxID=1553429 RepID=A0AAJ1TJL6_9BACL|nr:2-oxoisovalerate dehydrogenase E1 component alpha subunit [Croceifilum oryzae]